MAAIIRLWFWRSCQCFGLVTVACLQTLCLPIVFGVIRSGQVNFGLISPNRTTIVSDNFSANHSLKQL